MSVDIFLGTIFSMSLTKFKEDAVNHSGRNHCMTFFANVCGARLNDKPISFSQIHSKNGFSLGANSDLSLDTYNYKDDSYCTCQWSEKSQFCYILTEVEKDSIKFYRNKP